VLQNKLSSSSSELFKAREEITVVQPKRTISPRPRERGVSYEENRGRKSNAIGELFEKGILKRFNTRLNPSERKVKPLVEATAPI